jgi:hypothetical protein
MKVQIVGVERASGVSNKSGSPKPYDMATLHTIIRLDEQNVDDGKRISKSKGFMGASYSVDGALVAKIEHNSFPILAELVIEDVMRFGKRESKVIEVRPVDRVKQAA